MLVNSSSLVSRNIAVTDAGHAAENVPGHAAGQARGHALQEGVRLPGQVRLHPRHARAGPPHRVGGCHLREGRCVSKHLGLLSSNSMFDVCCSEPPWNCDHHC